MSLEPGQKIGRYLIAEQNAPLHLGQTLYRVLHEEHSYTLVMLATRHELVRRRLAREAEALVRIRHENLIRLVELLIVDEQPALVTELYEGFTLAERMAIGPLSEDEVDQIARGLLLGVAEAHRLGQVHRDLRPTNVRIVQNSGRLIPRIAALGLARALWEDPARPEPAPGTPLYLSPEQGEDPRRGDERSDLFSLGLILYEMITGIQPGGNALELPPIREVAPKGFPERMLQGVEAVLVPDPKHRVGTCEGLHALWRGVSGPTLAPPLSTTEWIDRPRTESLEAEKTEPKVKAALALPTPSPLAQPPAPREETKRPQDVDTVRPVEREAEPDVALAFAAGAMLAGGGILVGLASLLGLWWWW